jgi:hypothetical protein
VSGKLNGCKARSLALLAFLILSSCAEMANDRGDAPESSSPGTQQEVIQTIQPDDGQLSCEELMTQMAQMDQIASYSASGGESPDKAVAKAVVGTAASQALGFVPVVGPVLAGVAGAFSGTASNAGQQQNTQQNTMILAQQRKQHLLTLYDQKQCSAPSPE